MGGIVAYGFTLLFCILLYGGLTGTSGQGNLSDVGVIWAQPIFCPPKTIEYVGYILPFLTCDYHCRTTNGASSGACDDNYNCVCSGPTIMNCSDPLDLSTVSPLCLCTAHTPIEGRPAIEEVCSADCRCIHAAKAGACNYETQMCECDYTDYTWTPATSLCNYQKVYNATHLILETIASVPINP